MNTILAWLKSKNISSHTLAVLAIAAATAITTDSQVQQFLTTLFKAHPAIVADIVLFAGIVAKYAHSSSAAGTVANAQTIQASPNPPTATAVQAANVANPPAAGK